MPNFYAIVTQEGDSAHGIHFPDLPGCFSAADTLDEVPAKAREALSLWFEDEAMIAPSSLADVHEKIRNDLGYIDLMSSGSFLMSIPVVSMTGRTVKANLTMDAGLLQAIDETARERGITRSAFLADLARREIAA
ncbi:MULTISPECIES: type II toxin-antitoxin system HicB family antitoxin [Maricaulis]|uniref:HicB-like antitoxin of toxin-antitoxin system domain-containing protein n=1 Tax=Maricaulis maris (strain MCS10) TaxID=394221 RepID=Q0AMV0_MARMM|nr:MULTISPECIES: type II toxin-antitoxin system HicB family antitoxin [Maricaulis]ABI66387.1 protein of unknown function UPF0150 [Maricaulis maris MCS10]MAC89207.1 CopG family transcriptional regulator [Maricaulis sp.]